METISVPCPTRGCGGVVTVTAEPVHGGTAWRIDRQDGEPAVSCSKRCVSPQDLELPILGELQAG